MTAGERGIGSLRPAPTAAWLFCVFVAAAPAHLLPGLDPDASWRLVLNLVRGDGARFGPDVVFTYGPWGFLDDPGVVDPTNVLLGAGYAVGAVTVTWWAFRRVLLRSLGSDPSAVLAALVIAVVASPLGVSNLLLVGLITLVALYVADPAFARCWWVPVAVAAGGGFLLQVKLSVGACALAAAGLACVFGPDRRGRSAGACVVAAAGTFVLLWLAAGQHLTDVPTWLARSVEVIVGYSEAMGTDPREPWLSFSLAATAVVAGAGALARSLGESPRRVRLGLFAVAALCAYYGYRQGFGRFDAVHRPVFYVALLPPVLWAVAARPRAVTAWATLALVVVLGRNGAQVLEPGRALDRWELTARSVVDADHRARVLDEARAVARAEAGIGPALRPALDGARGQASVSVDGFSAGVAWLEGFALDGPPVFQSYVAYTAELDELNASWLRAAPAGHLILRPAVTSIDGRNSLWDPPRYVLEELCRTRVVAADPRWLLLATGISRCGASADLGDLRVAAGEDVAIPEAAPGSIVVASFRPDAPGPVEAAGSLLAANSPPLFVTADGRRFRLPRGLADGPLVTRLPAALAWPASHGGATNYRTLSFGRSGTVTFRAIPVGSVVGAAVG